jgi:hypothetical protein
MESLISQYSDPSRSVFHMLTVQDELPRSFPERLLSNFGFVATANFNFNSNSDSNAEVSDLWSELGSDLQTSVGEESRSVLHCSSGEPLCLNQKCHKMISLMGEQLWSWKSWELEGGRKMGTIGTIGTKGKLGKVSKVSKVSKGRREEFEFSVIFLDAG